MMVIERQILENHACIITDASQSGSSQTNKKTLSCSRVTFVSSHIYLVKTYYEILSFHHT
jgi:hypothetical protein